MLMHVSTSVPAPEQRLLDVASRLFYAEGIHSVGVDRVISEASVAKGTLYAHFPGKADLIAAYLERESLSWVEEAERGLAGHVTGTTDAIQSLFEMLFVRSQAPHFRGCPFINAAAEYPGVGPVATQVAAHRARVKKVFAAAAPADTAPEMLDAVIALYGGAMSAAHLDHEPAIVLHAAAGADRLLATPNA